MNPTMRSAARAAKIETDDGAHAALPRATPPLAEPCLPVAVEPIVDEGLFHGDTMDVISRLRAGTPASVVAEFAERLGISAEDIFPAMRLPTTGLRKRIRNNGMLTPIEQERIYRLDRVWWRALDVFDGEASACHWVCGRVRSIGSVSPLSLLDTPVGFELVLRTLRQIEYGIIS